VPTDCESSPLVLIIVGEKSVLCVRKILCTRCEQSTGNRFSFKCTLKGRQTENGAQTLPDLLAKKTTMSKTETDRDKSWLVCGECTEPFQCASAAPLVVAICQICLQPSCADCAKYWKTCEGDCGSTNLCTLCLPPSEECPYCALV